MVVGSVIVVVVVEGDSAGRVGARVHTHSCKRRREKWANDGAGRMGRSVLASEVREMDDWRG